ncbi:alpha/beta hydrolase [Pyxidicoccus fallax]|uniref:Alpha/beta hydrolase n=2 Tax=Pyxidicoccus fallax TaxID=394095 RepID=A0A848L6C4_9BACT|nr:alpha/beta hydrolase [Pyxidicoccus fallax]NPC81499.1 alpha/beta hydrolase [Pyxidicoccus fallax]
MFDGFSSQRVRTRNADIHLIRGGHGPTVLLLHGYPQTHACWHRVAPVLAREFAVIAPDLRGYGDSRGPADDADHRAYSKRALAEDMVEVMTALGHPRFHVVGHDRGARVAYRLALDSPDAVRSLTTLDVIPTLELWRHADKAFGLSTYHWFFLAQPEEMPERLITASASFFLEHTLRSWAAPGFQFAPEALAEYQRCFTPEVIRASCADYRAGATTDAQDDANDEASGRRIRCPMLALWSGLTASAQEVSQPLAIWRRWADDVRGRHLHSGHFLPEEAPDEVLAELLPFLRSIQG